MLSALLDDYQASLGESAQLFRTPDRADLVRHLRAASVALGRKRNLMGRASLTLVPGVAVYEAPAGVWQVLAVEWLQAETVPLFEFVTYPPPRLTVAGTSIFVSPTPTPAMIAAHGSTLNFRYEQAYALTDDETYDVPERDRWLLILRAQAEAMRELSIRAHQKPVTLSGAGGGGLTNMQPAALYAAFLAEFAAAS